MAENPEIANNVDAGFKALGPLGRYTLIQFAVQGIIMVSSAQQSLSGIFTGQKNKFRCKNNGFNISSSNGSYVTFLPFGESCSASLANVSLNSSDVLTEYYEVSCSAWDVEYENPKDRSFISEFDLVCEREFLWGLTQTVINVGNIFGAVAFPYITDHYGRKAAIVLCSAGAAGSALGLATSLNYPMFTAFKCLIGFFMQGVSSASSSAQVEYLLTRDRAIIAGCLASVLWAVDMLTLVPIAYLFRNNSWRHMEFTFAAFFVHLFLSVFVMDETLRWLIVNNRYERVKAVVRRAAKWNGKDFESVLNALYPKKQEDYHEGKDNKVEVFTVDSTAVEKKPSNAFNSGLTSDMVNGDSKRDEEAANKRTEAPTERLKPWVLFSHPRLRYHTLYCAFAWFINNLAFSGLVFMSTTLSGSLYETYSINILGEIPQAIFLYFYFDRLGRRKSYVLFCVITGVCLLGSALAHGVAPEQDVLITVLSYLGKFGVTGSYNVIFVYTTELFPTNIRNSGLALSFVGAKIGGMLAPYGEMLYNRVAYAPGLIFGLGNLFVCIGVYFLPETTDVQLPQTLAEMDAMWGGKKKTSEELELDVVSDKAGRENREKL